MARQSERQREREREALPENTYERNVRARKEYIERQHKGKLVVRFHERAWEESRQGRLKFMLHDFAFDDIALTDWKVFINDVRRHSGKHRHQGGLVIFVLEGAGWSIIDGERIEWKAGDLMLLPLRPNGGSEHQHFNQKPGESCRWMAFIYEPFARSVASELVPSSQVAE